MAKRTIKKSGGKRAGSKRAVSKSVSKARAMALPPAKKKASSMWIWMLVLFIIVVIGVLVFSNPAAKKAATTLYNRVMGKTPSPTPSGSKAASDDGGGGGGAGGGGGDDDSSGPDAGAIVGGIFGFLGLAGLVYAVWYVFFKKAGSPKDGWTMGSSGEGEGAGQAPSFDDLYPKEEGGKE